MRVKRILVFVVVLLLLAGCTSGNNEEIEKLNNEIEKLNDEIVDLNQEIYRFNKYEEEINKLKLENQEMQGEIYRVDTINNLSESDYDMMVMNVYETERYTEFKESYDVSTLKNLQPVSVMKLYLHAMMNDDPETEYELLTKNENAVMWSKEEHLEYSQNEITDESTFDIFKDVYDIRVGYTSDSSGESVVIIWKSESGYVDEIQGPFDYTFWLIKDEDTWKVGFMPMQ